MDTVYINEEGGHYGDAHQHTREHELAHQHRPLDQPLNEAHEHAVTSTDAVARVNMDVVLPLLPKVKVPLPPRLPLPSGATHVQRAAPWARWRVDECRAVPSTLPKAPVVELCANNPTTEVATDKTVPVRR